MNQELIHADPVGWWYMQLAPKAQAVISGHDLAVLRQMLADVPVAAGTPQPTAGIEQVITVEPKVVEELPEPVPFVRELVSNFAASSDEDRFEVVARILSTPKYVQAIRQLGGVGPAFVAAVDAKFFGEIRDCFITYEDVFKRVETLGEDGEVLLEEKTGRPVFELHATGERKPVDGPPVTVAGIAQNFWLLGMLAGVLPADMLQNPPLNVGGPIDEERLTNPYRGGL